MMKPIMFFLMVNFGIFHNIQGFEKASYQCDDNIQFIEMNFELGRRPTLESVKWYGERVLLFNSVDNQYYQTGNFKINYSRNWNELSQELIGSDIFFLRLSKDQYQALKNGEENFSAIAYTKNERGFIWVPGSNVSCQRVR